jgi:hypothetical protein
MESKIFGGNMEEKIKRLHGEELRKALLFLGG